MRTVLMIFALVLGHAPSPVEPASVTDSNIVKAASKAIKTSGSVQEAKQVVGNTGYAVTCVIQVENWTKFSLMKSETSISGGKLIVPLLTVLPGHREAMGMHKSAVGATGTYGVVSWLVAGLKRRFVVMWSVPYSKDFHRNWLALGMTSPGHNVHADWFDKMYANETIPNMKYQLQIFDTALYTMRYSDGDFDIVGQMGNNHKAFAKIIFRPVLSKPEYLWRGIREVLDNK